MIRNDGMSFGWNIPGLEVLSAIILFGLVVWSIKEREWRWWLIILGGGLNLIERVRWGYVTDYWKIPFVPIYNNINDWLIFGGAIALLWKYYMKMR